MPISDDIYGRWRRGMTLSDPHQKKGKKGIKRVESYYGSNLVKNLEISEFRKIQIFRTLFTPFVLFFKK